MRIGNVLQPLKGLLARGCLLVLCVGAVPALHAAVFSADAVKATFLHRFASYVEWPEEAQGAGPFVIGVAHSDEVAAHLDSLLSGITVRGRPATLRIVKSVQDLDGLHILYISPRGLPRTRALRAAAAKLPILLVTDTEQGLEAGGVINFIESNRNVRFEVSLEAADRARLRIDSALLAVAAHVERRPQ